jgi:hypothetical protein
MRVEADARGFVGPLALSRVQTSAGGFHFADPPIGDKGTSEYRTLFLVVCRVLRQGAVQLTNGA